MLSFAQNLKNRIQSEYRACRYELGWRLLSSPVTVLDGSDFAFIGLNPGGSTDEPDQSDFAPTGGSSYVIESWAGHPPGCSPLQLQVRQLFSSLEVQPECVLAGNLVPFRSPNWDALPHTARAVDFGAGIWKDILSRAKPKLIVTMGSVPFEMLVELYWLNDVRRVSAGWGNISIKYASSDSVRMVGLPHLSRFSIIGRPASESGLAIAFADHWRKPAAH